MNGLALAAPRAFAVALFFSLWAAIGREDFLYQKVKNRRLAQGALAVAFGYLVLAAALAWSWEPKLALKFMLGFLPMAAMNVGLCGGAAVLLWYFKIWPAGDVKLFVLLSALLPLAFAFRGIDYGRVFFAALVNTFLPAQLFVFALAVHYVVRSRLVHGRRFLVELGWRREVVFFAQAARDGAAAAAARAREAWSAASWRPKEWAPLVKTSARHVWAWLFGMGAMALISTWAHRWVSSPLVLSIGCTLAFASWSKVRSGLGSAGGTLAWVALAAALKVGGWGPFAADFDWRMFFSYFSQISLFGFFMYLGMLAMTRALQGGSAVAVYVVPLASALVMMILGQLFSAAGRAVAAVWRFLTAWPSLHSLTSGHPVLATLGGLPRPPAALMPALEKGGLLAALGMFFGLSLVLVRRWDLESRPTWRSSELVPRLLLAPDFVDRLREDEDFFEEHFSTMYPDGLTEGQAQALGAWCRENAVEAVPLAPTLSFASWIFLGYLLCGLLGGRHVLEFVRL